MQILRIVVDRDLLLNIYFYWFKLRLDKKTKRSEVRAEPFNFHESQFCVAIVSLTFADHSGSANAT